MFYRSKKMTYKRINFNRSIILGVYLALLLVFADAAFADIKLPSMLSDNMVLQQKNESRVWGWAKPGTEVTVTITEDASVAKPYLPKEEPKKYD